MGSRFFRLRLVSHLRFSLHPFRTRKTLVEPPVSHSSEHNPATSAAAIDAVLSLAPVMAVVTIDSLEHAIPLAKALAAGGLPLVEVTLRTSVALAAVERMAAEVPSVRVGVGTVLNARDLEAAVKAGASFAVSPGATPALLAAASKGSIPFLPGTASASDVMAAMEAGFSRFKLFPAENVGGVGLLKSLGGPLAAARFCPTGGITLESAPRYLALSNVACVGGSWIAPADLLTAGKFDEIKARAKAASALTRGAA